MLTILSNRIWNGKVYLDLRNSHHGSGAHMTQVQEPERQKFILSWHTCLLLLEFLKIKSNSYRRTLFPFILFLLCHECTGAGVRNFEVKINLVFQIWFHWIVSIALESGSQDTVTKENPRTPSRTRRGGRYLYHNCLMNTYVYNLDSIS